MLISVSFHPIILFDKKSICSSSALCLDTWGGLYAVSNKWNKVFVLPGCDLNCSNALIAERVYTQPSLQ